MSVTVALKPVYPFFIGGVKELRPTTAPLSRIIPPIYTMGGAVLSLLQKKGFDTEKLETLVLDEKLRIFGTYMSVKGRYYVPLTTLISEETSRKQRKLATFRGLRSRGLMDCSRDMELKFRLTRQLR